jgi:uncharacterized repeat protein (TIGR04076 family)
MPLNKVKITVLRKIDPEIIFKGQIPLRPDTDRPYTICNAVEEGQEFIVEKNREMPNGFCPSAWKAIDSTLSLIQWGGDFYPNLPKGVAITCCSDGIRPVSFKIERLET